MDLPEIRREIKSILVNALKPPFGADEIHDEEPLLNGRLHLDSIATIEILSEIENRFGIEIEDEAINQRTLQSTNAIAEMVKSHLTQQG